MKDCPYCGKPLPEEAHFCPYCTSSLVEKQAAEPLKVRKGRIWWYIPILFLALGLGLWLSLRPHPKTYDDQMASELIYTSDHTTWHLLLRNSHDDDFHWKDAQPRYYRMIASDETGALPLQLYIYDEASPENSYERFMEQVDSTEVIAEPQGGSMICQVSAPEYNAAFPKAALTANVFFDIDCSLNHISWTLHMKNGDVLVLHEVVEIEKRPEAVYSYQNTPLNTVEEIQALLDEINQEVTAETSVSVYLAPVVYEGDLTIDNHAISLIGAEEGETVFRGKLTIHSQKPMALYLQNLHFEGAESGILATASFFSLNCTFTGLDTGITAMDGCWPMVFDSTFTDCGTGLYMNSSSATSRSALYQGNIFKGNETAILLERVPGDDILYFVDCIFENNGTDIDNRAGNEIKDSY